MKLGCASSMPSMSTAFGASSNSRCTSNCAKLRRLKKLKNHQNFVKNSKFRSKFHFFFSKILICARFSSLTRRKKCWSSLRSPGSSAVSLYSSCTTARQRNTKRARLTCGSHSSTIAFTNRSYSYLDNVGF